MGMQGPPGGGEDAGSPTHGRGQASGKDQSKSQSDKQMGNPRNL